MRDVVRPSFAGDKKSTLQQHHHHHHQQQQQLTGQLMTSTLVNGVHCCVVDVETVLTAHVYVTVDTQASWFFSTSLTVDCLFDHITPALIQLHWLPIRQRVDAKLATITYKILRTGQPCYLNELIDFYEPVRQLRSSSQGLLYWHRSSPAATNLPFHSTCLTQFLQHMIQSRSVPVLIRKFFNKLSRLLISTSF